MLAVVVLLCFLSSSYAMRLRFFTALNPATNFTVGFWERVMVTPNVTGQAYVDVNFTMSANVTTSNITAYFLLYNSLDHGAALLGDGTLKCCSTERSQHQQCTIPGSHPSLLYKKFVFHRQEQVIPYQQRLPIKTAGSYMIELTSCENETVKVSGEFVWHSSLGFLFPEEYPLITISAVLGGIHAAVFMIFGLLMICYRSSLLRIHHLILFTLSLYIVKEFLWWYYYRAANETGRFAFELLGFVTFIQIMAQISRFLLMLLLSLGLGTNVSLLKTARVTEYDVMNIGTLVPDSATDGESNGCSLCLKPNPEPPSCDRLLVCRLGLFCLLAFVFQLLDALLVNAGIYNVDTGVLDRAHGITITIINLLLTLIFYCWVVLNLLNTYRFLKGHPAQLQDYKLFLVVGITSFILGLGIMGYKIYSKVLEGASGTAISEWNSVWENRLVWDIITAFLLFSIAVIWNPYRNKSHLGSSIHVA